MDWKKEAIDKLRGYNSRKHALENIPDEIARLESDFAGLRSAQSDGMPSHGGGNEREDRMLSNIVLRQELDTRLKSTRLWVKTVDAAMSTLSEEERKVLEMMHVNWHKGNVQKLCDELHVERPTVYRRRDEALRRFTLALYGSE